MLTIKRGTKLLPLRKYRAKSHIEKSDRQSKRLYIRTSCAYLISEPFTAKKNRARICVQNDSLSSRQSEINGKIAINEKRTGNALSQNKLSPPTPIQTFSRM